MKSRYLIIIFSASFLLSVACKKQSESPTTESAIPVDTTIELHSHRHLMRELLKKHKFKLESEWDSLQNFELFKGHKIKTERHEDYKVYGWHMYSSGSAYKNYNFSILSGVIYFSYELDPATGGYSNIHAWETTALVDSAKAHNSKVYLSVTNFGKSNNHNFLSNKEAQKNFLNTIIKLLQLRDADGVVLDFENVSGDDSELFTDFLISLSQELKLYNKPYECILCLYAIDYSKVFDIAAIDTHIDEYILMGYDFYGSFSKETGPIAPLHDFIEGQNYSVEYSVNNYLNKGINPGKIILGVPYYGAEWETQNSSIPSKVKDFISHPTYAIMKGDALNGDSAYGFDHNSVSRYKIEDKWFSSKQTWFDDSTTLALKYDWLKYKKLGGVAPWTLSYRQQYTDLTKLLITKFGVNSPVVEMHSKEKDHRADTIDHESISRANTLHYFINRDSLIQNLKESFLPWQYESSIGLEKEIELTHQVYGFFPFWKDDKGLGVDFALYSRIGYYAAVPNPETGKIKEIFNWEKINIPLANKYGCKVDLVIASYNEEENSDLLGKNEAIVTLIQEILYYLKQAGGDGVTLDFGYLKRNDKKNFTSFVEQLNAALKAVHSEYKLNIILPPIITENNKHFAYDLEKLDHYTDYFLLTGFDYYGMESKYAGPNAPLYSGNKWSPHDIHASTLKYLSLGIHTDKFILVVPYFGKQWITKNSKTPSKAEKFVKLVGYNDFAAQIKPNSERVFDEVSYTDCYINEDNNQIFQTWIDDSVSLSMKYDFVIKKNLAGAGIWAIGYDDGYKELTNALIHRFALKETNNQYTKNKDKNMSLFGFFSEMGDIGKTLWIIDIILVVCLITILLLNFVSCFIRSLIDRFLNLFYAFGFVLFVGTYFLIRDTKTIKDDGTIAIAIFIVIVCLILVKRMKDSNARKDYP